MNNNKTTAELIDADETAYVVKRTKDYDRFKNLVGNRSKDSLHLRRLVSSIQKEYLVTIIIVNEFWEIIDGQHRFDSARQLGLHVNYIMVQGYGLYEVHKYNSTNLRYSKNHYLEGYCQLQYKPYLELRKFMDTYPEFGIGLAECIVTSKTGGVNQNRGGSVRKKDFEDGKLIIPSLKNAMDNADKIRSFKDFYSGYNRAGFVKAMIGVLKNPNYDHKEMLAKVKKYPTMLKDASKVSDYKVLIEEVYNYRRSNKVNLRF